MLLVELFKDSNAQLRVLDKRKNGCVISFHINDKEYQFVAFVDKAVDEGNHEWWEVSFRLQDTHTMHYDVTNTGDAIQVFSAVTLCFKKLIQMYPGIKHISFTAETDEPSRIKLYNRMLSRIKLPGWTTSSDKYVYAHVYYLHKIDPKFTKQSHDKGNQSHVVS